MTDATAIGSYIERLDAATRCSWSIEVNEHRLFHESARKWLESGRVSDIDPAVVAEMIARDRVVSVQAYARTAVGFIRVLHYDLATALSIAADAAENYDK